MKIFFSGFYPDFKTDNAGVRPSVFVDLFSKVYDEQCYIGETIEDSDILCEFDMLMNGDHPYAIPSAINSKKWKHTYLFTGESYMKQNPDNYSCVLWGERNTKNIINIPLYIPYLYTNNFVDKIQSKNDVINIPKEDICVFISNPRGGIRNSFLNELDKHFKVTYAGRYKNNTGGPILSPYNTEEFRDFVKQYKFIVSMENSINDTYITEKITHGLLCDTIPIYWGTDMVVHHINKNRVLRLPQNCTTNDINKIIKQIAFLKNNEKMWKHVVSQNNFPNKENKLVRTLDDVAKDIKCLISETPWKHITNSFCICNPNFEKDRYNEMHNFFNKLQVPEHCTTYICPTYKHTITDEIYNFHVKSQLVQRLRREPLKKGELSLTLNYKSIFENIVLNYKSGWFITFESDILDGEYVNEFPAFLDNIKDKPWDAVHIGVVQGFEKLMFDTPVLNTNTGYRNSATDHNQQLKKFVQDNTTPEKKYIEDFTDENDTYRMIRKFSSKTTDVILWKYDAIVKINNFMDNIETNYALPFDFYLTHFLEMNIDTKFYWTIKEFFKQSSFLNLSESNLGNDKYAL